MRLKHFIISLGALTVLSLFYVGQQTEVIKLAYRANKINKQHKELLDRNRYLRYNLISLKSSYHLGGKLLSENTGFEIPRQSRMISLASPGKGERLKRDASDSPSGRAANIEREKPSPGGSAASGLRNIPRAGSTENINNPKFLKGIKDGMLLSALKIEEVWPISAVKSYYIDKEAQAQDFNK